MRPSIPEEELEKPEWEESAASEEDDAAGAFVGTPNAVEEPTPKKKLEEKPVSRAERRQKIKEEIRRLSEGQERVYYQRRLW